MTRHLLFVPADPAMLANGPCGARAPMAAQDSAGVWCDRASFVLPPMVDHPTRRSTLVLVWDGVVVVEGVDRLVRALNAGGILNEYPPHVAQHIAELAESTGLGRLVVVP